MKSLLFRVILISLFVILPAQAFAGGELKALKFGPYDAAGTDYIELVSGDLEEGEIEISGSVTSAAGIQKVQVSLDAGVTWTEAKGTDKFKFNFTPKEEVEYPVIIRGTDASGKTAFSKVVVTKFISADMRNEFNTIFEEIKQLYIG